MLYSDFDFWLCQQSVEVQILAIYLMGFSTIVLYLLNCWYNEWIATRAKKKRIKKFEKLFDRKKYHII